MNVKRSYLFFWILVFFSFLEPTSTQEIAPSSNRIEVKQQNQICLTMIVKNESRIIERCLDSVKGIIDCVSICDTGSTDNTVEIIENYLQKHAIPGKVHRHAWKNFGYNRTLSAQSAQQTLKELGFSLPNTYLLLLDADMVLAPRPTFKKESLSADSYHIQQENTSIAYYNTRLLRASLPWESVGVTHEAWACKDFSTNERLETLLIDDREDGGSKADKFERDIKLLTQGLIDEPDNVRYMFYLAQSYRCIHQYDEAIKWYQTRIDKGGWNEEVYYSKYMLGEMYEEMGNWDLALHWYLSAYEYMPKRAEPLHKIATHYRREGQNQLAYFFAKQGLRIPYPKELLLFISYPTYNYELDHELSISAYYTPYREEGMAATDRLILNPKTPHHLKENAYHNMIHYVQNLSITQVMPITLKLPPLFSGSTETYSPMNPSIQKTKKGYNLICRTVNWTQSGGKNYHSRDPNDPTIRTKNFLVRYDKNFKLLSQQEIIEDLPRQKHPTRIVGLEDCRFIKTDKNYWILGTTFDTHPGTVGQSVCKIKPAAKTQASLYVDKLVPLQGPSANRCEKNWLPFIKDGQIHAIYSYQPTTVLKIDPETGRSEIAIEHQPTQDFSNFRGSAAPIPFDGGYLALVHEVVITTERTYFHRLVFFDSDFNIIKISKPFTFFHKGVEYSCGMITDHEEKELILSVGLEDKQAFLLFVDLDYVRSLLEPIKQPKL